MNCIFESNQPRIEERICFYLDHDSNNRHDLKNLQLVSRKAHSVVQNYLNPDILRKVFFKQEVGSDVCAKILSFVDRGMQKTGDGETSIFYEYGDGSYDPHIMSTLGISNATKKKAILLSGRIFRGDVIKLPELCAPNEELVLDFDYPNPSLCIDMHPFKRLAKTIRDYFYIELAPKEFKPRFPNAKELILTLSGIDRGLPPTENQERAILTAIFDAVPNLKRLKIEKTLKYPSNYQILSKLSSLSELYLWNGFYTTQSLPELGPLLQYCPNVEIMDVTCSAPNLDQNRDIEPNQSLKTLHLHCQDVLPNCEEIVSQAPELKNLTLSGGFNQLDNPQKWKAGWLGNLSSLTLRDFEVRTIEFDHEAKNLKTLKIIDFRTKLKSLKLNAPKLNHLSIFFTNVIRGIEGLHHSTKLNSLHIYGGYASQLKPWAELAQMPFLEKLLINWDLEPPREVLQKSQIKELFIFIYPNHAPNHIETFFRTLPQLEAIHMVSEAHSDPIDKNLSGIQETITRKDLE